MPDCSRFVRAITVVLFSSFAGYGQVAANPPQISTPFRQVLGDSSSILHSLVTFLESAVSRKPVQPVRPAAEIASAARPQPGRGCAVTPLDPINDPAARQLETADSPAGVVDVLDMVPAAAQALDRFEARVAGVGGTMVLKSAYRPASYQQHLQNVWYKWMVELRNNHDPACQDLKAQVQDEFKRHRLIETQHPVAISDHTRGIAFDATVDLPPNAKIGRRRLTLDSLARMAGLLRPAIASDPVHFKYLERPLPGVRKRARGTAS